MSVLQSKRGPGKNKRKWTPHEDAMLVETLLELLNNGTYKADNGFKPGVLRAAEIKLESKLPSCGLKAKPHIESRIKTIRAKFGVVFDMLSGNNTSGFGWDPINKCVTAEKSVWDAYCEVHKNADAVRDTPFPYYDEYCIIFGKDRATGRNAESPADVVEEMEREVASDGGNQNITENAEGNLEEIPEGPTEGNPTKKRRSGNFSDFREIAKETYGYIDQTCDKLCKAVENDLAEKQMMLNGELSKLQGLTRVERHKATCMIGAEEYKTNIFFSLPDDEKEDWVKTNLNLHV